MAILIPLFIIGVFFIIVAVIVWRQERVTHHKKE